MKQDGMAKNLTSKGKAMHHADTGFDPVSAALQQLHRAVASEERIWREGYGWRKAGVLLLDLGAPGQAPVSLFDIIDAPDDGLMKAMDQINARYGRGTARLGLAQKDGEWHMRRENLSPSFTTRWGDIPSAKMG